jgi:uncharacterized protein (TIGR03435 family)
MNRCARSPLQFRWEIFLAAVVCVIFAGRGLGQAAATPAQSAAMNPPAYDVVSIRPHKDNSNGSRWWWATRDGYQAVNLEVVQLIREAYGVQCQDQLVGLPAWAFDDVFDLEARIDEESLPAYQKLSDRERQEQSAPLLRAMLADRFQLKVHHETRMLPIYALVIAKSGFKLKQAQGPENLFGMTTNRGLIFIRRGPVGARFIVGLSNEVGRVVIDKTGLTGYYDIELKWTTDEDRAAGVQGPSLFTALEEQLGLGLVSTKAPVDVIVVDHVERPTAN